MMFFKKKFSLIPFLFWLWKKVIKASDSFLTLVHITAEDGQRRFVFTHSLHHGQDVTKGQFLS